MPLVPIGAELAERQGDQIEADAGPRRSHLHPDRRPILVEIQQLRLVWAALAMLAMLNNDGDTKRNVQQVLPQPSGQRHHYIHGSQTEDDVEEAVIINSSLPFVADHALAPCILDGRQYRSPYFGCKLTKLS